MTTQAAGAIWDESELASPDHPTLVRLQLLDEASCARVRGENLVLSLTDPSRKNGEIVGVILVGPDGTERWITTGEVGRWTLGRLGFDPSEKGARILVVGTFAEARQLHWGHGVPVMVATHPEEVAEVMRKRYEGADVVVVPPLHEPDAQLGAGGTYPASADFAEVFGSLADSPRWVAWKEEGRAGRATKVPYSPATGRRAKSTNPADWVPLEEAMSYREHAAMDGVGIVLGDGLGGVDLDACRDPETGDIARWARQFVDGFATYTEVSPSGTGLKLFAFGAPEEKLPASWLDMPGPPIHGKDPHLEAYTEARYFTVTGRILDGAVDEIRDAGDVGDAWDRLVRLLREKAGGTPATNGSTPAGQGLPDDVHALLGVLDADCPHDTWLRVGMALHHADREAGFAIWDTWSATAEHRYPGPEETRRRWASFDAQRERAVTVGTLRHMAQQAGYGRPKAPGPEPDTEAEPVESEHTTEAKRPARKQAETGGSTEAQDRERPDPRNDLDSEVEKMNRRHFVTLVGGKAVVCTVERDPILDRERLVYSTPNDIELFYRNQLVPVPGSDPKPLGKLWLGNPARRTYKRVVLDPTGRAPADHFNLWRGLGVEPAPGEWSTIRDHLRDVICDDDEQAFDWLTCWLARCVQRPELRAETCVVLRGPKGTGKGMVGRLMRRIFRSHFLQVSNPRHLTGHFNQHLQDALFLFGDEVVWGGDRTAEGVLKALVTEASFTLEAKYLNATEAPNRLKILLASNSEWVVPATADERRFFVLDVPPTRKGDTAYFAHLAKAIDEREASAFLFDLLKIDLSEFDHRNPPHTAGLNAQKIVGADSFTSFWFDCLSAGEVVRSTSCPRDEEQGVEERGDDGWPKSIVTQVLHRRYVAHARDHGERHPMSDAVMAKQLRKLLPDLGEPVRSRVPWGSTARPWRYNLPVLATCRQAFLNYMNIHPYEWPGEQGPDAEDATP